MNQEIVLMYHAVVNSFSSVVPHREIGAAVYDVSVRDFAAQMKCLNDYQGNKLITVTFDDGEMNNFMSAYPILKQYSRRAYFFIIVNRVGQTGYMGWKELKELAKSGMTIGSHGLTHRRLTQFSDEELRHELVESKNILEKNLSQSIETISIPRGFFNKKVIESGWQAGYKKIFISESHYSGCISRVAVKGSWNLTRFQLALDGRRPLGESILKNFIDAGKYLLGDSGYDRLRSVLLKKS